MNRRTCACGVIIVCADLDGLPVWLDAEPSPDGMLSVRQHGDSLDAVVDGTGPYRRHVCAHDPEPLDPTPSRRDGNDTRQQLAARRDIAAIQAVRDAGLPLTRTQRRAADLRAGNPDLTYRRLAQAGGITLNALASAIRSIRDHAARLDIKTN